MLAGPYSSTHARACRTRRDLFPASPADRPAVIKGPATAGLKAVKTVSPPPFPLPPPQMGEGGRVYRMLGSSPARNPGLPVDARGRPYGGPPGLTRCAGGLQEDARHDPERESRRRSRRRGGCFTRAYLYLPHVAATAPTRIRTAPSCPLAGDCPEGQRRLSFV